MDVFTPQLLAVLMFLLVMLIAYALRVRKSSIDARFEHLKSSEGLVKYLAALGRETSKILPERLTTASAKGESRISEKLRRAGNPWGVTATEFMVIKVGAVIFGLIFGVFAYIAAKPYAPSMFVPLIIPAAALLLYMLPDSIMTQKAEERMRAFRKELPEANDLLVISTSVSNSMEASLQTITPLLKEGVVKDEFTMVCKDLSAGRGLTAALTNLAERAPSSDIEAFVNVVIQAQNTGSDMTEALKRRSKTSRQEYAALIDSKIASLEGKITIYTTPTIIIALMILTLSPVLGTLISSLGSGM